MNGKVLIFREPSDGLWNVIHGTLHDLHAGAEVPDERWIAEGVGSWERAMRIAAEVTGMARCGACESGEAHR